MLRRLSIPFLLAAALLVSGCAQSPEPVSGPEFAVRKLGSSPTPGAGGLVPGSGAATSPGGSVPGGGSSAGGAASTAGGTASAGAATTGGSAQGLGQAIILCAPGTPWEYSTSAASAPTGYKVTYTIHGKTTFKTNEYCKVSGKVEVTGVGLPANYIPAFDYYFRVDPTGLSYSDIWYVITYPGAAPQEFHVEVGAGGAAVGGSGATTAGAAAVPTPSIPTSIAGVPTATASGKPPR